MKEQEVSKLELLLTINENIVVQRFFNVRDFNPKSKNSIELHEYVQEIVYFLKEDLKTRTIDYMLENSYQIMEDETVLNTDRTNGPELFNIYLKHNEKTFYHCQFDSKLYPPKVRYTVDVRSDLKNVLSILTDIMSSKNLTYNYLEVNLS